MLVFINIAVLVIVCALREFWRGTAGTETMEVEGGGVVAGRTREEAEDNKRSYAHAIPPANPPLPHLGISSAVSANLI